MTTEFSLKVTLTNGEIRTFKDDAVMTFEMQDRGLFFVHSNIEKNLATIGKKVNKVHYRYVRNWIPYVQIKDIEILTNKVLTDPAEIEKYQKFLKHGLDIMMTPVSNTVPKTAQEVQDEINGKKPEPAKTVTPEPEVATVKTPEAPPEPKKEEDPPTPAPRE